VNQNGINKELRDEIKFREVLIKKNCFQCKDIQYIQEDDLAMGAPISSIFFFLNFPIVL
jgi:hypothetical protein